MKLDYGPLRTLFETDDISEIMVNSWNNIFVEHQGLLVKTAARFVDQRQFDELIYTILNYGQKKIDSAFTFDGILPGGERYNITLPPLSPKGPTLTIRKFLAQTFSLDQLVQKQFLSDKAALFLKSAVASRLSLAVSGGTGSGKTSFLNSLGAHIPQTERIVSIEDVAELRLNHPNWVALQCVNSAAMSFSARQGLINALRMRPDRIIVGECRKDETLEMLQAMNTGHEGSMTTIHANSAVDCLSRIESLVMLNGFEAPLKQLRFLISKALNLIVQIRRRSDGRREIVDITEITGMDHDTVTRATIFERDAEGNLVATGYVPNILKKMTAAGHPLPQGFFEPRSVLRKSS